MAFEGNWQLQMESPMGTRPASLSIRENTGSLEGSLTTSMGTASVSGRANGSEVEFSASMSGPMGAMNLTFTGTVEGDQASGQVQFGSMGSGSWSASRAEEGEPVAVGSRSGAATAQASAGSAGNGGPPGGHPGGMPRPQGLTLSSFTSTAALKRTFDSLSVPGYRNLWLGFMLQMGAMQMLMLTGGYYVFELTGRESLLGIVVAAAAVPAVTLALFGGVVADRMDKKRVIQASQMVSMGVALFIAVSITTGTITWYHLLAASAMQGSVMPLVMPARQAITPQLVGMDRLTNAVALNAMVMSLTTMAVPVMAGTLIAEIGVESVYYVIAGMYVLAVLFTTRLPKVEVPPRGRQTTVFGDIRDGFRYVFDNRVILVLLLLSFATIIFAMPIRFILPIFAKDVFEVGADGLGVLMSAMGLGALGGTLMIAFIGKVSRRGLALAVSGILSGLVLLSFAATSYFVPMFATGIAILVVVGMIQASRMTLTSSLMMEYTNQEYRGRVMSIFGLNMGIMPAGVLPVTLVAERLGAPVALGIMAGMLILVAFVILLASPRLRQLQ
ncbi:MAG: MFS transporter [Chloroflexota bacterium]|nr:MFS transporter [Chloroflexota bacterium]MDE2940742.1 MFS transporter [Chloroflexota bacterium]MDE3266924.1 MFS transporter [Chloroflexota bacterium]